MTFPIRPAAPAVDAGVPCCLFLAGGRPVRDVASLLDQLGLGEQGQDIRLLDTPMHVHEGPSALALFERSAAAPQHSIGDSAIDPPLPASLIALTIDPVVLNNAAGRLRAVQHLCIAALAIGSAVSAGRIFWPPAQLWSPFAALKDAVVALQDQGLPPVLQLVAMVPGEAHNVTTCGLSFFCGIEITLSHPPAMHTAEAVRRLARLAIHAMVVGPLQPGAAMAGLEPGEALVFGAAQAGDPPQVPVQLRQGWA